MQETYFIMFKKILFAAVLSLSVVSLSAQENNEKQSALILYAGPQFSMANVDGGFNPSCKFSYLAGVGYERNNLFNHFGLFGALEFSEKGTKNFLFMDGRTDSYNLRYLQLNIGLKYQRTFWGIQGFGEVGPYLAYGIGGTTSVNGYELDEGSFNDLSVRNNQIQTDGGAGFKRFDIGFKVAIGVEFHNIQIKAGYQRGFMNIADDQLISNGYKNHGFFITAGYAFKL